MFDELLKVVKISACVLFIFSVIHQIDNKKTSYNDLVKRSVFVVNKDKDGGGTGVVVKKDITSVHILTNKHVCSQDDNCNLLINGKIVKMDFVKESMIADLSLWKLNRYLEEKEAIKGIGVFSRNSKVYSVGNYLGLKDIYTEGTVAGFVRESVLLNMPCSFGCSGSGVYNKDNLLIGVIFAVPKSGPFSADTAKSISINSLYLEFFLSDILDK